MNEGGVYEAKVERSLTHICTDEDVEEMQRVCQDCIVRNSDEKGGTLGIPLLVGVALDLKAKSDADWILYVAFSIPVSGDNNTHPHSRKRTRYGQRIQFPLVSFGHTLAQAFDKYDTDNQNQNSYKVCFVADASSGLGSRVLHQVFQTLQNYEETSVVLAQELAWLSTLAHLLSQRKISRRDMERILYGLLRWTIHSLLGGTSVSASASKSDGHGIGQEEESTTQRTVLVVLPGQSCTAALWPLLQSLFPNQQFMVTHDSCIPSIQRGILLRSKKTRDDSAQTPAVPLYCSSWVEADLHVTAMPRHISATIPMTLLKQPTSSIGGESNAAADGGGGGTSGWSVSQHMSQFSSNQVDTLEAWMTSLDTLLPKVADTEQEEKDQDKTTTAMSNPPLWVRVGIPRLNEKDTSARTKRQQLLNKTPNLLGDESEASLKEVLFHVLGLDSSPPPNPTSATGLPPPLSQEVMDAAKSVLTDIKTHVVQKERLVEKTLTKKNQLAMEQSVFELIGV